MAIQAVVFDLDGVLVDSIEVMQEAFQRAYNEVVGPGEAPIEEYLRHLGRHMPDSLALMGLPAAMYEPFVRFSRDLVHHIPACEGACRSLTSYAKLASPWLWPQARCGPGRSRCWPPLGCSASWTPSSAATRLPMGNRHLTW